MPDKYRFPEGGGSGSRQARPRYNRVTPEAATSRACRSSYLSCLPVPRSRKGAFRVVEKGELNIPAKAEFIRFSLCDLAEWIVISEHTE